MSAVFFATKPLKGEGRMGGKVIHFTALSGNQLKIIALFAMTLDHIGLMILPQFSVLRVIGRLAMPIFAYMIAEGCYYTKNRAKYFSNILGVGVLCQIVYWFTQRSLEMCILITFSMSIILIYAFDAIMYHHQNLKQLLISVFSVIIICVICLILPTFITGFTIDYDIFGVILPLLIYLGRSKREKLLFTAIGLAFLALDSSIIQWYALLSLPLLAMYNGQRGKYHIKILFYAYFPMHLAIIYIIALLINR
jgi:hypothetical protein